MTAVTITTAVPLSTAHLEKIKKVVAKKYGQQVKYAQQIDSTVIGGIKIRLNSIQLDATVAHHLSQLQHHLLHITT